jgi:hypothetical protein
MPLASLAEKPWLVQATVFLLWVAAMLLLRTAAGAVQGPHSSSLSDPPLGRPTKRVGGEGGGWQAADKVPLLVVYGNIPRYWGMYVVKEFDAIVRNLTGELGWESYIPVDHDRPSWEQLGWDLVVDFGRTPDVILFLQDFGVLDVSRRRDLTILNDTVVFEWVDDMWYSDNARDGMRGADVLFPTYEYLLDPVFHGVLARPRVWMPHSVMPAFLRLPLNATPVARVLLVGSSDPKGYPLRWLVTEKLEKGDNRFNVFKSPGWHVPNGVDHQGEMGEAMNGHLATIADGSSGHFLVGKCFEMPASGALMIMSDDIQGPLAAVGFLSGVHYLAYNKDTLDAVVDWVLAPANRAAVDRMRAAGREVALAVHQTHHRTAMLHAAALQAAAHRRICAGLSLDAAACQAAMDHAGLFPRRPLWNASWAHGVY